eukprot:4489-Heterococcus_DN1.PRE.1
MDKHSRCCATSVINWLCAAAYTKILPTCRDEIFTRHLFTQYRQQHKPRLKLNRLNACTHTAAITMYSSIYAAASGVTTGVIDWRATIILLRCAPAIPDPLRIEIASVFTGGGGVGGSCCHVTATSASANRPPTRRVTRLLAFVARAATRALVRAVMRCSFLCACSLCSPLLPTCVSCSVYCSDE